MGYTTDFRGQFRLDKKLDDETYKLLVGLSTTRRMARNLPEKYGVEGEFYCDDGENFGQNETSDIINYNTPPATQPGLWCHWEPTDDMQGLEWDGGEKFYNYTDWIIYLIDSILKPRGYTVNGVVDWVGEDVFDDRGTITVRDNVVSTRIND